MSEGEDDMNDDGVACIGVDIGGTFTDAVLTDGTTTWRASAVSSHSAIANR